MLALFSRLALLLALVVPIHVRADADTPKDPSKAGSAAPPPGGTIETPTQSEFESRLPTGEKLTGREVYDRFLKNRRRLRTVRQEGRILSNDPGGNPQEARFWLHWKDYRDANDDAVEGTLSRTLIKFVGPREMRHVGYLYIHRDDRDDEQFMYSPSRGRVARVRITGENVAGSDFSTDDFLVGLEDIEDADYVRLPDESIQGVSCYVVDATMKPQSKSQYSKSRTYLEKEHYVPLRTRYWDDAGVEVKEATSPHASIKEFDSVWVPTEIRVADLLEETHSTLHVDVLDPNPTLGESELSVAYLSYHP